VKVLLLSPSVRPALTGNATTVDRWARGLQARGHGCAVAAVPGEWTARDVVGLVEEERPALVHLHHAERCGRFVDEARARAAVVVSFAGTDLIEPARSAALRAGCRADVVVAGGDDPRALGEALGPSLAARVRAVPRGVELGTEPFELRSRIGAAADDLVVLLPAGVRPVKAPRFPIGPLERLRASGLPVRYVVLGRVLDRSEGEALDRELAPRPWCSRLEARPGEVASALAASDLVLNCSLVEGFSNAVAEALAAGRAVLAADNPGNRAAIEDGKTGVLYRTGDSGDFADRARALLEDASRRRALGVAARAMARERFDPEREIDALLESYRAALVLAARMPRSFRGRALPVAT
jgi:glycosyltransferase involved in cell wall biosynthesis